MLRLKELRMNKNLSMVKVARALSIPYTTYVNYEKGAREPNSEMLKKIADFFDVSIDYLIGRSDKQTISSLLGREWKIPKKDIFILLENLNDAGYEKIHQYALDIASMDKYKKTLDKSINIEISND